LMNVKCTGNDVVLLRFLSEEPNASEVSTMHVEKMKTLGGRT
jgi:hypothetical protein